MASVSYAEQLELAACVTEPAIRQAIGALKLPDGSHGLDAGCGIGTHALWLCEATGGKVDGVDINSDHLAAARDRAEKTSMASRVEFVKGDIFKLPFKDDTFDWVWCADTLWPVVIADPVTVLKGLSRMVKPWGTVAVLYWTNQILLPGYPQLEARLNLAFVANTHYFKISEPAQHHMRALGWLRSAGLLEPKARSFVSEAHAPLSDELRKSIGFCFSMFWGGLKPHLEENDWFEYVRVCTPDSPHFILNSPDYYCTLTYTLFHAKVPGN